MERERKYERQSLAPDCFSSGRQFHIPNFRVAAKCLPDFRGNLHLQKERQSKYAKNGNSDHVNRGGSFDWIRRFASS